MEKVELRRKRIINFIYFAIVLGLSYLFFKYCFGMFFPFLFAFFIAIIVQKPTNFLVRKTKIPKGIVASVMVIFLIGAVIFLLSLLGVKIVDACKSLISFVTQRIQDLPTFIENVRGWTVRTAAILPNGIEAKFVASANRWFDVIKEQSIAEIAQSIAKSASGGESFKISSLAAPLSGIWNTAKQIPSILVAIMISIVSSCFMAADYDTLVNFVKNQLSDMHKGKLSTSKRVVFKSIGKIIRSYALIICITGAEIFVGLSVLKLLGIYTSGNILAISVIVAVLDILPVIGTGTFMIPWSIYSFITDKVGLGIGLLVIYAIVYVVRQIIEPKIVGGTVGLPPVLTLMGMYIGSQLFGFIGIFLLPILLIIVKLLNDEGVIHLWHPSAAAESAEPAESAESAESVESATESEKKLRSLGKEKKSKKK